MTIYKLNKPQSKLIIFLLIILFIITSSVITLSLSVFIIQFIFASITIFLIRKKDYKTANLYCIIFIISITFIFLVYFSNKIYFGSPYYIGGSDDLNFENWGRAVYYSNMLNPSKILESGIIGQFNNSPFFAVYISILIRVSGLFGGYSTFLPRITNTYYLVWSCMIFEYLIKKYANFTENKVYLTIALFGLTPNILYISSYVFRDTFNLFQILVIIYLFDKLFSNKNSFNKIFLCLAFIFFLYITYYTRTSSLIFAGTLCIFIVCEKLKIKKRFIILSILPILYMSNTLQSVRLGYFVETYSNYVLNIAGDGLSSFVFGQPLLPFGIIFRILYAFITPFPNIFGLFNQSSRMLYDFTMLLIYGGVAIQILAIPFILKRIYKFDWLSLSFITWFLAIISTTFTFRHIILYYPFMVAVGVDGYITSSKLLRKNILFFTIISILIFGLIYVVLKFL